ncbi:MAG: flagellar basal body-associated FliL family protein, partial [Treponema sp.]|nr:flagellar basal body-associated FliL family protein [Treponema sp.]
IVFAYKKNDKKVSSEITAHRIEITDTLRNFFSKQTRESLKPINEKPLRLEILRLMNANIMENQKILDVRFTKLEVLQK